MRRPTSSDSPIIDRHINPQTFAGGIIGQEGILYLGSKQIRIEGKNERIIVNDGTNDRVLIGKF